MAPRANRQYFRVRLHGFSVINLIALAIIMVCLVEGTESARDTKAVKTSKSSKEKVRLSIMRLYSTSVQQSANSNCSESYESRARSRIEHENSLGWIRRGPALRALYLPSKRKLDIIYTVKWALFIMGDTKSSLNSLRRPREYFPPSTCSGVCCQILNSRVQRNFGNLARWITDSHPGSSQFINNGITWQTKKSCQQNHYLSQFVWLRTHPCLAVYP